MKICFLSLSGKYHQTEMEPGGRETGENLQIVDLILTRSELP